MKTYCRRMDISDEYFIRKYITAFIYDKLENGNMPSIFAYYGSISKNEATRLFIGKLEVAKGSPESGRPYSRTRERSMK